MAAYMMGVLKGALEWVTVPVLALALCMPHGALVYWLSSSSFTIAQVLSNFPAQPAHHASQLGFSSADPSLSPALRYWVFSRLWGKLMWGRLLSLG